jgi:flagellar export protein FliJ
MMGLDTLARLHRARLDEKRRRLADLRQAHDELVARAGDLENEIRREQELAGQSEETIFAYGNFATASIQRRHALQKAIAERQTELATLHEELAAAFREIKKYEVVIERRRQQEFLAEKRREQAALDEIGLDMHRRNTSGP